MLTEQKRHYFWFLCFDVRETHWACKIVWLCRITATSRKTEPSISLVYYSIVSSLWIKREISVRTWKCWTDVFKFVFIGLQMCQEWHSPFKCSVPIQEQQLITKLPWEKTYTISLVSICILRYVIMTSRW